jgi:catechol 2,3-dioxygenase-like lactoylglutathione lyase family enzyme
MEVEAMTKLLRSAPYFPVPDVERSAAYYRDVLGFDIEYSAGTPPEFAICGRDGLAIMLRKVPSPDLIRPVESQGGTWDAFFWAEGLAALHAELVARGATIVYGPVEQAAYHMREFAVRDLDGHVLGFGEPLEV